MNENNLLYAGSVVLLILILTTFKFSRNFAVVNIVIYLLYSGVLYYGFFFKSGDGTALAWWFYLAILTSMHLLVILGYIITKYLKKN